MDRPCASGGGAPCTRSSPPKAPSALRASGGTNTAGPRAITSAWRTRAVCVSGSSVRDFIALRWRAAAPTWFLHGHLRGLESVMRYLEPAVASNFLFRGASPEGLRCMPPISGSPVLACATAICRRRCARTFGQARTKFIVALSPGCTARVCRRSLTFLFIRGPRRLGRQSASCARNLRAERVNAFFALTTRCRTPSGLLIVMDDPARSPRLARAAPHRVRLALSMPYSDATAPDRAYKENAVMQGNLTPSTTCSSSS